MWRAQLQHHVDIGMVPQTQRMRILRMPARSAGSAAAFGHAGQKGSRVTGAKYFPMEVGCSSCRAKPSCVQQTATENAFRLRVGSWNLAGAPSKAFKASLTHVLHYDSDIFQCWSTLNKKRRRGSSLKAKHFMKTYLRTLRREKKA